MTLDAGEEATNGKHMAARADHERAIDLPMETGEFGSALGSQSRSPGVHRFEPEDQRVAREAVPARQGEQVRFLSRRNVKAAEAGAGRRRARLAGANVEAAECASDRSRPRAGERALEPLEEGLPRRVDARCQHRLVLIDVRQ
jgi:hypothetical protein